MCHAGGMLDEDPGWSISWRSIGAVVVPGMLARTTRRAGDGVDHLVMLRQLFLSFVFAVLAFGLVLVFLYSGPVSDPLAVMPLLVGLVGVSCLGAQRVFSRPLDLTSPATLAGSYRTRFFLRMALGETPALFGFVGFFVYDWWLYPLGLAFTAVGFAYAAPSARNLAADQERIDAEGSGLRLIPSLRGTA